MTEQQNTETDLDFKDLYKKILRIRLFEDKIDELFKKGLIHGTAHLCTGQEFIPAIISYHLKDDDFVTSTHRGHGHAISKGLEVKKLLAELMGKIDGYCLGKGGTQHVMSKYHKFFSSGITGGMVPIANGIAFANKYKKNDNIVVAFLGDGGLNEGYVMESLNIASVFQLPILFVCENNFYAMSTHVSRAHSTTISERVKGFGIQSETVRDNDFVKLNEISRRFIKDVREKKSPRFIEVQTYRHKGHSKNDLNFYRDKKEEEYWLSKDVVIAIERKLLDTGGCTKEELASIRKTCEDEIEAATEYAMKSNNYYSGEVLDHVYAK